MVDNGQTLFGNDVSVSKVADLLDEPSRDDNCYHVVTGSGTAEASKTPAGWGLLSDLTNDGIVNGKDYSWQAGDWLKMEEEQPGDLNRDGVINFVDLELLSEDWLEFATWYE